MVLCFFADSKIVIVLARPLLTALPLYLLPLAAAAQPPADTIRMDTLPAVEITATRTSSRSDREPFSVSVIDASRVGVAQPLLSLAESLPFVPGVFVMNDANFAQDLRVSIRGFGARAGFGIRGVKILLDGIPESSPDGQAQVDNIDPAMLERIEVLRGPSAGLYGNASGGVLSLSTGDIRATGIEARAATGSFGFKQLKAKGDYKGEKSALSAGITHVAIEGFRRHAAMSATMANAKFQLNPGRDSSFHLSVSANFTYSPQGDDPGGLSAAQDSMDRRAAHPSNIQFKAGESLRQGRIALIANKRLSHHNVLKFRTWYVLRDFENRLPFRAGGQVAFQRMAGGGLLQYEGESRVKTPDGQARFRYTAGMEADRQSDDRQRYNNENGERGPISLRQDELFGSIGLFAAGHWQPAYRLTFSGGARADMVSLSVRDRFLSDGDQSGRRDFRRLSPWSGAVYQFGPRLNAYANAGTNFETPTLIELSNNPSGAGGFAAAVGPQITFSMEAGLRGRGRGRLFWEITVFRAHTRDELSPYELPDQPGRTFFRNAGSTLRRGLETALSFAPARGLELWGNYTYSDFKFEAFQSGAQDLSGKALPGLPRSLGQLSARYTHRSGLLAQFSGRFTGSFYADNANAVRISPAQVYSMRIGRRGAIGKAGMEFFLGLDNLGKARVFNNIRINAAAGRYFEAGAGRSLSLGLTISSAYQPMP